MDTAIAPFPKRIAKLGQSSLHRGKTLTQAVDIQSALHYATVQTALDYRQCATPAERKDLLPYLAKATDAWRIATDARHNAQGRPRAGSLSPAERAEMRRRKSARSSRTAPTLAKPAAPTLAVPPPSDAA